MALAGANRNTNKTMRVIWFTTFPRALFFGYASAPQTGKIRVLGQGTDFGLVVPDRFLDARQTRIGLAQLLGLGQLLSGAVAIALDRVAGCKIGVDERQPRI